MYRVFGYQLMSNHVHIVIESKKMSIGDIFRRVATTFAMWFNRKYKRCGHVFQGRFFSDPLEGIFNVLNCLKYIFRNPIEAGMCNDFSESELCGIRSYINDDFDDGLTDLSFVSGVMSIEKFVEFCANGRVVAFSDVVEQWYQITKH